MYVRNGWYWGCYDTQQKCNFCICFSPEITRARMSKMQKVSHSRYVYGIFCCATSWNYECSKFLKHNKYCVTVNPHRTNHVYVYHVCIELVTHDAPTVVRTCTYDPHSTQATDTKLAKQLQWNLYSVHTLGAGKCPDHRGIPISRVWCTIVSL